MREETSVVFREAWVEFVIESESNKMAEAKHRTQMKFLIFKAHRSFVVFHTSQQRNMQLILPCVRERLKSLCITFMQIILCELPSGGQLLWGANLKTYRFI